MTPPRPVGASRKAQFAQWVWDEIHRLKGMQGDGVYTTNSTRGVIRRSRQMYSPRQQSNQ